MKSEELKTQELLEKTNKQDYLIERIDIEDSPFTIVGNKEMGYMGTMGKWKITEYTDEFINPKTLCCSIYRL